MAHTSGSTSNHSRHLNGVVVSLQPRISKSVETATSKSLSEQRPSLLRQNINWTISLSKSWRKKKSVWFYWPTQQGPGSLWGQLNWWVGAQLWAPKAWHHKNTHLISLLLYHLMHILELSTCAHWWFWIRDLIDWLMWKKKDRKSYPKVPTTRVEMWEIWVLASEKDFASPKSETWWEVLTQKTNLIK